MGPYDALMRTGGNPMIRGQQAMPVHHVGKGTVNNPEPGSIKSQGTSFLDQVEGELGNYRPGSHAYNKLMQIRGSLLGDISDMDTEHQILNDQGQEIATIDRKAQDFKARAMPYGRGITPEGRPVR